MTNDNGIKVMQDPEEIYNSTVRVAHNMAPEVLLEGIGMDLGRRGIKIRINELQCARSVNQWFLKGVPNCLSADCVLDSLIEVLRPYLSDSFLCAFNLTNIVRINLKWVQLD